MIDDQEESRKTSLAPRETRRREYPRSGPATAFARSGSADDRRQGDLTSTFIAPGTRARAAPALLGRGQRGQHLSAMTRGCLAGTSVCFVSNEGRVYPCGYLPVSAGDTRVQRFADIWNGSSVFQLLLDPGALEGKCGDCRYEALCGGCRAHAYAATGSYLAEEPFCTCHSGAGGHCAVKSDASQTTIDALVQLFGLREIGAPPAACEFPGSAKRPRFSTASPAILRALPGLRCPVLTGPTALSACGYTEATHRKDIAWHLVASVFEASRLLCRWPRWPQPAIRRRQRNARYRMSITA